MINKLIATIIPSSRALHARMAAGALATIIATGCAGMPVNTDALNIASKAWEKRETISKAGQALRKGFSDLTPEEEYFIGRAVAAKILSQYSPVENGAKTAYINTTGQILARASSRPETFAGYHFALISSNEINAFAAPGGFVFITTGLYARLKSEEQLAAVLAHEISHVTLKHGLSAIKAANLTQAFTIIGSEAIKEYGARELAQLTEAFEDSINDIVNQLVVNGYSRSQEYDADKEALQVAYRAGYDPGGLTEFLGTLASVTPKGEGAGFYKTHPPAADRQSNAASEIKSKGLAATEAKQRSDRFKRFAMK
ncbi:MAG: M48 family metalloprotease [Nitrospinota bacterium]|nr:M48 family metalloprotease [Nitrospinota bacterium]